MKKITTSLQRKLESFCVNKMPVPACAGINFHIAGMTVLVLFLLTISAQAGELRVTINMATGSEPLRYTLTAEQTRGFWQRWRGLKESTAIVPMPQGNSYGGLTLYDADGGKEVRLYSGIGRLENNGRADEFRQLERWVLGYAPPPLGPALITALDEEVRAQPGGAQAMPPEKKSSEEVIATCRYRAGGDARRKALCLQDNLMQQLDMGDYARALEAIVVERLPPRALLPANPTSSLPANTGHVPQE